MLRYQQLRTTRVRMLSFGIDTAPQSFATRLVPCRVVRCLKSAQKSAVQVCEVSTVLMKTIQLVLSQFKFFLS